MDPLTLERSSSSYEAVSVPASLPHWKLHHMGSKIILYQLLTEGIPDEHPPVYITHILDNQLPQLLLLFFLLYTFWSLNGM